MKCKQCSGEVFLDHITEKGDQKDYWYVCMNPRCKRKGIAFRPLTGEETESKLKPVQ